MHNSFLLNFLSSSLDFFKIENHLRHEFALIKGSFSKSTVWERSKQIIDWSEIISSWILPSSVVAVRWPVFHSELEWVGRVFNIINQTEIHSWILLGGTFELERHAFRMNLITWLKSLFRNFMVCLVVVGQFKDINIACSYCVVVLSLDKHLTIFNCCEVCICLVTNDININVIEGICWLIKHFNIKVAIWHRDLSHT